MNDEFSAWAVASQVVTRLERRREALASDEALMRAEVDEALASARDAYLESALPPSYFAALEQEVRRIIPESWQAAAARFTALEGRSFGSWRGGDVYARVSYVFGGLLV